MVAWFVYFTAVDAVAAGLTVAGIVVGLVLVARRGAEDVAGVPVGAADLPPVPLTRRCPHAAGPGAPAAKKEVP